METTLAVCVSEADLANWLADRVADSNLAFHPVGRLEFASRSAAGLTGRAAEPVDAASYCSGSMSAALVPLGVANFGCGLLFVVNDKAH